VPKREISNLASSFEQNAANCLGLKRGGEMSYRETSLKRMRVAYLFMTHPQMNLAKFKTATLLETAATLIILKDFSLSALTLSQSLADFHFIYNKKASQ
jgi:hypothetical protein